MEQISICSRSGQTSNQTVLKHIRAATSILADNDTSRVGITVALTQGVIVPSQETAILSSTAIDEKDATYQAWNDGTISLRDYLTYAASQNWIDVSALTQDDAYLDSQEVYQKLTEVILDRLANNTTFAKKMYHYMLLQDMLDGYDICNLMYDQNLLTKEDDDYAAYVAGNMTPFQLLSDKIARHATATLIVPPASFTAAITAEPRNDGYSVFQRHIRFF